MWWFDPGLHLFLVTLQRNRYCLGSAETIRYYTVLCAECSRFYLMAWCICELSCRRSFFLQSHKSDETISSVFSHFWQASEQERCPKPKKMFLCCWLVWYWLSLWSLVSSQKSKLIGSTKANISVCFILNVTTVKFSCCVYLTASVTFAEEMSPRSRSHTFDVLRAAENNTTTSVTMEIQARWRHQALRPLWKRSVRNRAWPWIETAAAVCLVPGSDLKWRHAPKSRSPRAPVGSYMDEHARTRETQPTLLPWQPSQRITVLQHRMPPTTLAVTAALDAAPLCWDAVAGF